MIWSERKVPHNTIKNLFPKKWPALKQLKYLPHFLNAEEKRIIAIAALVALISLFGLLSAAPSVAFKTVPQSGGNYTEGIVGGPQFLNPVLAKNNEVDLDLTRLVFSGLFKYNEKLEAIPDLAKTITISSDNLKYQIELKNNVSWHDGQPLTAEDVVFTFQTIQNSQIKSPWASRFNNIQVAQKDKNTISLTLKKPLPDLYKTLTLGIIPKHIWQNIPIKQFQLNDYNLKPIGSGPWRFEKINRNIDGDVKSYVLTRNENFYDAKPFLKKLTFNFYTDFDRLGQAASKNQLSGVSYLPKHLQDQLGLENKFKKYNLQLPQYTAVFFNGKNNNALSNKAIRQALAYATPKQGILNEVLSGQGQIIDGPFLPESTYYNPNITKYSLDLTKAAKLLSASGWQKGADGFWHQGDKILEISLTTVQQSDLEKTGQLIQKSWQELGVKTKLIVTPTEMIQKEIIIPRNYDALLFGVISTFDADPYPLWHSSQFNSTGINLTSFKNSRVDELLEKANNTPFDEVRKKKYLEFQTIITDESPAIFIYSTSYTYLVNKNIKGINISKINVPADRHNSLSQWYLRTKKTPK